MWPAKWAFLIIEFLGQRTMRFAELRREVGGISHKMLTQNLRMLERNGLLERTVHPPSRPASSTPSPRPVRPCAGSLRACVAGPSAT